VKPEVRTLIATMARDNPHGGTDRIRSELLKLGIAVSARSIRRHRRRGPAGPPSPSWRTFLANHAQAIWAVSWTLFTGGQFRAEPIMFSRSTDGGQTFSPAKKAHPCSQQRRHRWQAGFRGQDSAQRRRVRLL